MNSNNEVQDGRFGQKINLTVILYNKFGRIQAYISKLNESLNIPARQQRTLIREQFHNVNVTISGIQVTFQIILHTYDDFTNYTITACNKEGCYEFIVYIMLTGMLQILVSFYTIQISPVIELMELFSSSVVHCPLTFTKTISSTWSTWQK